MQYPIVRDGNYEWNYSVINGRLVPYNDVDDIYENNNQQRYLPTTLLPPRRHQPLPPFDFPRVNDEKKYNIFDEILEIIDDIDEIDCCDICKETKFEIKCNFCSCKTCIPCITRWYENNWIHSCPQCVRPRSFNMTNKLHLAKSLNPTNSPTTNWYVDPATQTLRMGVIASNPTFHQYEALRTHHQHDVSASNLTFPQYEALRNVSASNRTFPQYETLRTHHQHD